MKFVDPIKAQAKVIANVFSQGESEHVYDPESIFIRVKTRSLPIVIYKKTPLLDHDEVNIVEKSTERLSVELRRDNEVVGYIFAGDLPQSMPAGITSSFLRKCDFHLLAKLT